MHAPALNLLVQCDEVKSSSSFAQRTNLSVPLRSEGEALSSSARNCRQSKRRPTHERAMSDVSPSMHFHSLTREEG